MATPIIKKSQCSESDTNKGHYSIEASMARFPVGAWPAQVELDGQKLIRASLVEDEGDIQYAEYRSPDKSTILTVFND